MDADVDVTRLSATLAAVAPDTAQLARWISDDATRNLKFSDCLPANLIESELGARLCDDPSAARAPAEAVRTFDR